MNNVTHMVAMLTGSDLQWLNCSNHPTL